MYIFNRARQAASGHVNDAFVAAVAAGAKATEVTGVDIYTWMVRFGRPSGTVMWSVRLDSQAQLMELDEQLAGDAGMAQLVSSIDHLFDGPSEDRLTRMISGTPASAPKKFIATTEASMANGKYAEAMAWGAEMQEFVGTQSGLTTAFGMMTYGGFADLIWLLGADDMDDLDKWDEWRMSDQAGEYHQRIHAAAGLFVEGSGQNGLIAQLG